MENTVLLEFMTEQTDIGTAEDGHHSKNNPIVKDHQMSHNSHVSPGIIFVFIDGEERKNAQCCGGATLLLVARGKRSVR